MTRCVWVSRAARRPHLSLHVGGPGCAHTMNRVNRCWYIVGGVGLVKSLGIDTVHITLFTVLLYENNVGKRCPPNINHSFSSPKRGNVRDCDTSRIGNGGGGRCWEGGDGHMGRVVNGRVLCHWSQHTFFTIRGTTVPLVTFSPCAVGAKGGVNAQLCSVMFCIENIQ